MPTYDYRCPSGHEFEHFFRKISDATAELPCPQCGAVAARRVSGGAGLLFKGSGFYLTDYGRNAHRKAAPESGKGESAGGDGKSDSKKEASRTEAGSAPGGGTTPAKSESAPASPAAKKQKGGDA